MSATIGNLEEIKEFLNADLYTGNFRPIKIKEYVKCENNMWSIDVRMGEIITQRKKLGLPVSLFFFVTLLQIKDLFPFASNQKMQMRGIQIELVIW